MILYRENIRENSLYLPGIYQENSREIVEAIAWYFSGIYTWANTKLGSC